MLTRFSISAGATCGLVLLGSLGALFAPATAQDASQPPGPAVQTSDSCAMCHAASDEAVAMRDRSGASVAPFDLWQSTMMANSSRDPFWRAAVDAELAAAPEALAGTIAAKCLRCHAPMADRVGLDDHGTKDPLHALRCDGELGGLAADGVSCTICHGMLSNGLGAEASFTGGFELDPWRRIFGPHEDPFVGPMRVHTGFEATYGDHIESSKLCGSCHTLITQPLDEAGSQVDDSGDAYSGFHEQTPYLEWRNSDFTNEAPGGQVMEQAQGSSKTCQDCHVPRQGQDGRPIRTELAHNPGGFDFPFLERRSPFGRHLFVGGNTLVLSLLRDHGEALGVKAPTEAFDATIQATRDQLAHRSASLTVSDVRIVDGVHEFDVQVTNLTGHKLPTGHPSRRMWLEVLVTSEEGEVLLASGRFDEAGLLIDGAGAPLPTESRGGPIAPHRQRITQSNEVARYRAVMEGTGGEPTHTLMRGAGWYLDNRILPRGWDPEHPDAPATAPAGVGDDPDYAEPRASGTDRVTYAVQADGPVKISARLLYQPVSPRWVDEIARFDTPSIRSFLDMWNDADRRPEVLAATVR